MANIPGQLEGAQLENLAADPTNLPDGRTWLNTATSKIKTVIGAAIKTLVTEDGTQTLTNKTLTSPTVSSPTVTGGTFSSPAITTPTGIVKGDVGLGNVDNTSDATKNAASATLTNKTLTAPVINSPTGIVKADVGLGNVDNTSDATKNAAVATLTNKTLTSPVINSPTGIVKADVGLSAVTNDAQLKIASNLSDLASAPTARTNLGLGTIATQNANAVAITGGQISGAKNVLYSDTLANLTALPRLAGALYYATDTQKNYFDNGSVLTVSGSGSGGGAVNYITGGDFENGVVGAVFKDADATTGVLSGGAPTATITSTTSSPLNLTTSGVYTPQAGIGAGWSALIAINREDQAQVLQGQLSMEIATYANYTDGDLKIAAYDVTNGARLAVIEGETIPKASGPYKHTFRIQTAPNSTSYRIGFIQTTTTTTWGSLKFEISLGPQLISRGAVVTDLVSYTPTFVGLGTVTNIDIRSRRTGSFLEVIGRFTTGTPTAVLATMSLGHAGINGNVTSIAFAGTTKVGDAVRSVNATALDTVLGIASSNLVYFGSQQASGSGLTALNGSSQFGAGQDISINIRIPIQGWSSNTAMSADVSARPAIFRATGVPTGTLANGSFNVATFPTVQVDNYGKYSAGVYTIPKTGYYDLYVSVNVTGTYASYGALWTGFNINGGTGSYKYAIVSAASAQLQGTSLESGVYLTAGTTVQPTVEAPGWSTLAYAADGSAHTFSIVESAANSGQQIAATERICATYGLTTLQAVGATSVIKFDTKIEDTHGLFSTGTGLFTSNFTGKLRISTALTATIATLAYVVKNGTGAGYVASPTGSGTAGSTIEIAVSAGDTVGVYLNSACNAYGAATQGYQNQVTFERVT